VLLAHIVNLDRELAASFAPLVEIKIAPSCGLGFLWTPDWGTMVCSWES
jgi:hypothetical protein